MNEKQARTVIAALDFWTRMRIGQWKELVELCLPCDYEHIDEWCRKRDDAELLIMSVRDKVMPELSYNASYGVFRFEETERAFNVMEAVRSAIAWHKNPQGGYEVIYDRPRAINVAEEMPKCEVVDDV
jgi:hypothetical protein